MKTVHQKTIGRLLSYKNRGVVERISKEMKISMEEAEGVFQDTVRFLYLSGQTKRRLVPTRRIDEGWHAFILFTKDYAGFCEDYLGRFVHHCPKTSSSLQIAQDASAFTFELAVKYFGPTLSENWAYHRVSEDCESNPCTSSCSPDSGGGGAECSPDSGD